MKIEHLGLFVADLEAAKDFYTKYFDGQAGPKYHNPRTGFSSYFINLAEGARLELCHKADLPQVATERLGLAYLAFSLGSKEAVDAKVKELRAAGCDLLSGPRITGDGCYEAVVTDLEGNLLELTTKKRPGKFPASFWLDLILRLKHPLGPKEQGPLVLQLGLLVILLVRTSY